MGAGWICRQNSGGLKKKDLPATFFLFYGNFHFSGIILRFDTKQPLFDIGLAEINVAKAWRDSPRNFLADALHHNPCFVDSVILCKVTLLTANYFLAMLV